MQKRRDKNTLKQASISNPDGMIQTHSPPHADFKTPKFQMPFPLFSSKYTKTI